MEGWTEEEMRDKNLMAPCGKPLFRGAQLCRACKKPVAEELDGSL